jgi:demethylphylloquinone reductase
MSNNQRAIASDPIRICILGGGFGGLYTALYLSRFSWVRSGQCQVILVEQNDRFLFTPLLYELITGELQRWEIAPSYQKLLAGTKIDFCQQQIADVDLQIRQVVLNDGAKLNYDYLVLSVGMQNRWTEIPGVRTHGLTFRTLNDVERLDAKLQILEASDRQYLRLVVIGGGPSGVESACKLADRIGNRGEVALIERGEQILKTMPPGAQSAALRSLRSRNVFISYLTDVSAVEANSITMVRDRQTITQPVDLVLWTAGTQIRDLIDRLDCYKSEEGKLLTHPTLQLIDYPEVLALGDIAEIRNGGKPIPTTAQVAYQQASRAAKNLKAIAHRKRSRHFRYLHLGDMLTLGKGSAVVSSFFLNLEGQLAAIIRQLVYIQRLPTSRHRLQVFKHWLSKILNRITRRLRRWFSTNIKSG